MRWELRLSTQAVQQLYRLERELVTNVWAMLRAVAEDPSEANLQASEEDPSLYWLAVEGDITVWVEIIDERHAIRIVKIG